MAAGRVEGRGPVAGGLRIRVNGRGNAWPLELGASNPRHAELRGNPRELCNTSFSVVGNGWNVLIDAGSGVVAALIAEGNVLPSAVVLTHPHFDHIAGLDWLVASHRRHGGGTKLPVYATPGCWSEVSSRFAWLVSGMEPRPLTLGATHEVPEAKGLTLVPIGVFHGPYAPGATMIVTQHEEATGLAVFTGDLLVPLLREIDIALLKGTSLLFAEANTRFPSPNSGHWSLTRRAHDDELRAWVHDHSREPENLCAPHTGDPLAVEYLSEFVAQSGPLPYSVEELVDLIAPAPKVVHVVHYSGFEDRDHDEAILTDDELREWIHRSVTPGRTRWNVARPGDVVSW